MRSVIFLMPWLLLSGLTSSCHKQNHTLERSDAKAGIENHRFVIGDKDARGISGLDDFRDGYIAVAERSGHAFFISRDGASTKLPIAGFDDTVDLEGVASLDDEYIVFSTERNGTHDYEEIWLGQVEQTQVNIVSKHKIQKPKEWTFGHNNGLEGICITESNIWVIAEIDFQNNGQRSAGLARIDKIDLKNNDQTNPTWFSLPLTSKKGKLSALDCKRYEHSTTLWAVERHFGVARIIEFDVPENQPNTQSLVSTPVLELSTLYKKIPNFEGILREGKNDWTLINDNEFRSIDGDTFLLKIQ